MILTHIHRKWKFTIFIGGMVTIPSHEWFIVLPCGKTEWLVELIWSWDARKQRGWEVPCMASRLSSRCSALVKWAKTNDGRVAVEMSQWMQDMYRCKVVVDERLKFEGSRNQNKKVSICSFRLQRCLKKHHAAIFAAMHEVFQKDSISAVSNDVPGQEASPCAICSSAAIARCWIDRRTDATARSYAGEHVLASSLCGF
jgi:hypothetical protein